jgi:Zn-finger nucleic acid-binding protein
MSSRQNIEIDYCPQCRGVWLDRGELDKLIERSVQEAGPAPAPQQVQQPVQQVQQAYRGDDYGRPHSGYGKQYKKKSFWHEIFD